VESQPTTTPPNQPSPFSSAALAGLSRCSPAHAGDDVELPSAVDVEVAVVVGYDAGMVTLSLPIDDSLAKSLEETAKKSGLSTTEFVTETLRAALDDRRYRDAVDRGLAAVTAGRTIDSDVVERWLESWGSDDELEPPTCDG